MLKIIIVDDEEKIRLGLAKLIEKASPHYQIVGLFADAYQVIEAIQKLQADIMFTDIMMPGMSGLDLIEQIHKHAPNLECIILSGYGEFNYARKALQFGVASYLLKPVDKIELYETLKKMESIVIEKREDRHQVQGNALRELLNGKIASTLLQTHLTKYKMDPLDFNRYLVMVVQPIEYNKALSFLNNEIQLPMNLIEWDQELIVAIVYLPDINEINDNSMDNFIRELRENIETNKEAFGVSAIGLSRLLSDLEKLKLGLAEAKEALEYNLYTPEEEKITLFSEVQFGSFKDAETYRLKIRQAMEVFDVIGLRKLLKELFVELAISRPNQLFKQLDRFYPESTLLWTELKHCRKLMAIYSYMEFYLTTTLDELQAGNEALGSRTVLAVKKIIETEYRNELSLHQIAEKVFLTASYLSKLFKHETGGTITEYMTMVRINKAKELLKNNRNLKTYEVGEFVGYTDSSYFNKLFKKEVGVTPKEYRDHVM